MAEAEDSTTVLTFKYKLLLKKKQHRELDDILESQRILYNAALQERNDCYRKTGRCLSYIDQCGSLTELRKLDEFSKYAVNMHRWTIKRVDEAYQGFFRRLKGGGKAGFPRFRGAQGWSTFGFNQFLGVRLCENRVKIKGMSGSIRLHLHRSPPNGRPLLCTFTKSQNVWHICLQYRVASIASKTTGESVGVDVGLISLATLSTGEAIPNPRHSRRASKELRRKQRALSRCRKGSNRRKKAKEKVVALHRAIANTRKTNLHQVSSSLIKRFDVIAVESLNVKGLAAGNLSKSINDAAWSTLKQMLTYKAAKAGRRIVQVKAAGTSQTCPECGQVKAKSLAERVHHCDCGCVMDRDHAAAIVILQRACNEARVSQRKAVA